MCVCVNLFTDRLMVLKHHPDKCKGTGEEMREGDEYFTCITKAYEVLGVPAKRTAYDSVDPEFDDSVPSAATVKKNGFFQVNIGFFPLEVKN